MTPILVGLRVLAVLVVLTLALIALLSATHGSVVRRVRDIGASDRPVSPREPEFAIGVAMLTGVVLMPNNSVELAANGAGTFSRLWQDLRSAQRSISIQREIVAADLTRLKRESEAAWSSGRS